MFAASPLPLSTKRGSLNGIDRLTLPFTALYSEFTVIVTEKRCFVNPFLPNSLNIYQFQHLLPFGSQGKTAVDRVTGVGSHIKAGKRPVIIDAD